MRTGRAGTSRDDAMLVEWLGEHSEPCPACGYDLRDAPSAACPECGVPIRLGVATPNPVSGGWLLAVIACSLASGFDLVVSLLFSIGATIQSLRFPPPASAYPIMGVMLASFLVPGVLSLAGMIALVRGRTRWHRAPREQRLSRGIAIFIGVGLTHAFLGILWVMYIV